MYELVIDICNELDVNSLCYKILQNVCILFNVDRCLLFLVYGWEDEDCFLEVKFFDVSVDIILEEVCENREVIRIFWGMGIIGYVVQMGELLNILDVYKVILLFVVLWKLCNIVQENKMLVFYI